MYFRILPVAALMKVTLCGELPSCFGKREMRVSTMLFYEKEPRSTKDEILGNNR
jgi:hypothetical protein